MGHPRGEPIVSVSGVRGVIGRDLRAEDVVGWGAAFATVLDGGEVLVGRDARASGPMVQAAVTAGLMSAGADAIDLGLCPTPTVQVAVPEHGASGGVVVTASHNPPEWNALKFVGPDGRFLARPQIEEVARTLREGTFRRRGAFEVGTASSHGGAVDLHIERILELGLVDVEGIRSAGFRVGVDACNGAGSVALPRLLEALGCRVFAHNCIPSGAFPRGPEPTPENIEEFCREVAARSLDAGFAVDPDADRLAVVTERGDAPGEESTLPLVAGYVLDRSPGPVGTNLSTSSMIDGVAKARGCEVHRSPVGEANVVSLMAQKSCVIGGEGNGGVIVPALHYGRDSLVGTALVLSAMAAAGVPLSSLCEDLPRYVMLKTKVDWTGGSLGEFFRSLREKWNTARFDESDGLKAAWKDKWVHVRPSGTEPVLRIIAEAPDGEEAAALLEEATRCLKESA